MKASTFCEFFEFDIKRISNIEMGNYEVYDLQGVFHSRYVDDVSELIDCFDSMLNDYIDDDVEVHGFSNDENNTEKSYYEQMLDWMQANDNYKDTTICEVVACLVNPELIIDDTEEE